MLKCFFISEQISNFNRMKRKITHPLLFLFFVTFCFGQKEFSFELGAATYGFENGLVKSNVGIRVEKHLQNEFSLNYQLSFGKMDIGYAQTAYTLHMPAGTLLGCVLAASVFSVSASNSGALELVPYCFMIPEGVSYYPYHDEKMDFGLTADLLGVNYSTEKSPFASSRLSYQQNFSAVCKFRLKHDQYIAARIGYQMDYYLNNTVRGLNAGISFGFSD
jgi:hypothetical protein